MICGVCPNQQTKVLWGLPQPADYDKPQYAFTMMHQITAGSMSLQYLLHKLSGLLCPMFRYTKGTGNGNFDAHVSAGLTSLVSHETSYVGCVTHKAAPS
jgi:hypothetical protein